MVRLDYSPCTRGIEYKYSIEYECSIEYKYSYLVLGVFQLAVPITVILLLTYCMPVKDWRSCGF
jgi:hypothetical protein